NDGSVRRRERDTATPEPGTPRIPRVVFALPVATDGVAGHRGARADLDEDALVPVVGDASVGDRGSRGVQVGPQALARVVVHVAVLHRDVPRRPLHAAALIAAA